MCLIFFFGIGAFKPSPLFLVSIISIFKFFLVGGVGGISVLYDHILKTRISTYTRE